jgi:hypothetical protein
MSQTPQNNVTNYYGISIADFTGTSLSRGLNLSLSAGTNKFNIYAGGTANNYMAGSLGIGSTSLLSRVSLQLGKNITGDVFSYGVIQTGSVQSDVTNTAWGFQNQLNTQATTFTVNNYRHYSTAQGTLGAGSVVANQFGFYADNSLIGATANYGFFGNIASGTNRWNLYMQGTANNFLGGSLGIGTTQPNTTNLYIRRNLTGATTMFTVLNESVIQSDVTSSTTGFFNQSNTQAASFTLGTYSHFQAAQGGIGAGSSITTQQGFVANANLTGATNNYGFRGLIPAGTGRFNLYMDGTANNYLAGNVGIGTDSPATKLHISGAGAQTLRIENTNTAIVLNDIIGSIVFQSNDASVGGTGVAGSINSISEAASGVNYGLGFNTKTFATEIERMRITSAGNVGIGTSSPANTSGYTSLTVNGTTGSIIELFANGTRSMQIVSDGISSYLYGALNTPMIFYTNATERMRITSAGNVGIGTTSPSSKLQIQGTGTGAWLTINRTDSGSNIVDFTQSGTRLGYLGYIGNDLIINNAATSNIQFNSAGIERMRITSGGNVLVGTTTDAGFKLDVVGTARISGVATFSSSVTANNAVFNGVSTINLKVQNAATANTSVLIQSYGSEVAGENASILFKSAANNTDTTYAKGLVSFVNNGTGAGRGSLIFAVNNSASSTQVSASDAKLTIDSTGAATFASSVTATSFFESSDKTLKTLITDNYQAEGIELVTAKLYTKNGKEELGYFAQDVQAILPSAVNVGSNGLLSLSYREVHTAKIARLEKRVEELEKQLNLK